MGSMQPMYFPKYGLRFSCLVYQELKKKLGGKSKGSDSGQNHLTHFDCCSPVRSENSSPVNIFSL